jgi:phage repressor protein C with HTH and peptisase S24 domain/DNA-binding XRE family transcriptional regulator
MKSNKTARIEWSRKVLALRHGMGLTQAALASKLHYSAMALSRWERGTHEPPAQAYIRMGNLAGEAACWWFWAKAGFLRSDLLRMVPEGRSTARKSRFPHLEIVEAGVTKRKQVSAIKSKLVAIPVLAAHAGTHGEQGDNFLDLHRLPVAEMIAAPTVWCPNPAATNCFRVRGSSMSPLIHDKDVVAVDCSNVDPSKLSGKIVVVWQKQTGLTISRLLDVNGVHVLESENRAYEPVKLDKNRGWRIIGKVLWWIRHAP